jgi:hypothetical protein
MPYLNKEMVAQTSMPVSSGAGFHPAADFQSAFLTSAPSPRSATTFESVWVFAANTGKNARVTEWL